MDSRLPGGGVGTVAPPIGIFHPIFNQFVHDANDTWLRPSNETITTAQRFTYLNSTIWTKEEQGNEAVLEHLGRFLGQDLAVERNPDNTSSDGMVMFQALNGTRFPLLILECRRNLGEGGCDPSIQAGLRMRRTWIEENASLSNPFLLPYPQLMTLTASCRSERIMLSNLSYCNWRTVAMRPRRRPHRQGYCAAVNWHDMGWAFVDA